MIGDNLTNTKMDVLKELGNIGAGNATTALSVLLNSKLEMELPIVNLLEFDEIADLVGGADTVVAAVLTRFTGDVNGMTLFIVDFDEAKKLISAMLNKSYSEGFEEFDHMDRSTLKEVGNILMSSYIGSISTLTGLEIRTNPPEICVDMTGAILSQPLTILGQIGDQALIIDSKLSDNNRLINGFILFVADDVSFDNIFSSLGIR
ncbi:MAG: chemotaxis protein CheC [Eubacteriales bacterium]|nr:chemotaxis protein CheC [Eubacteriales bacterium]